MFASSTITPVTRFRRFDANGDLTPLLDVYERAIGGLDPHLYSHAQRQAWRHWGDDTGKALHCLNRGLTVVALQGDRLAGFAQLYPYNLINMLYVAPEHSRQGIGTQLVFKLEKVARRRGVEVLETRASHASRRVFSRCGFQLTGSDVVHAGGVAIARNLMIKTLQSDPKDA